MPIYEYVCQDCNAHFEVIRSMKEADEPIACQECHSIEHIKRMLSVFVATSGGQTITGSSPSCDGCSGGSCASCHG